MATTKQIRFTLAVLGMLAIPSLLHAQVDPLTQQQAQRMLMKVAPPLNEVVGAKVVNLPESSGSTRTAPVPKLEFQSIAEFRRAANPEIDILVRARFPQLTGKRLERAQEAARDAFARVALAQYRPGTDTIVVAVPLDDQRIAGWSKVASPDPPSLAAERTLQLALAHEAVRMYLDRQFHWHDRLMRSRDDEESQVLRALVAGQALAVTEKVADRLGAAVYADLLVQRYRIVPDEGPDPERLMVVKAAVFNQCLRAATDGKAFFAYLDTHRVEGGDRLAFSNPPHQAFWMTRPELYVKAVQQKTPSLKAVLAPISNQPPAPGYTPMPQPLTPDMIREVAGMFKEQATAERLIGNWEEGQALIWVAPGNASQIVLSVTRFSSPEAARAYHGFAIDLQRKRDEQMSSSCTGTCRVLESNCRNVEMKGATAASSWTKKIQVGKAPPVATNMLYVLAGNLIIEIDGFRIDPDPAWAQRVVDNVLRAHEPTNATKAAGRRP